MTNTRASIVTGALFALAVLILSLLMFNAAPAHAEGFGCNIGASAGANALASRQTDGSSRVDIGTQNVTGGVEAGCSYFFAAVPVGTFSLGALARYDLLDTKAAFAAPSTTTLTSLKSNGRWMALGKLGYELNPNTRVYALAGVASTKWTIADFGSSQALGIVTGGGLDLDLGHSNLSAFIELNRIDWRGAASVAPIETVGRVGLRIKLGGN